MAPRDHRYPFSIWGTIQLCGGMDGRGRLGDAVLRFCSLYYLVLKHKGTRMDTVCQPANAKKHNENKASTQELESGTITKSPSCTLKLEKMAKHDGETAVLRITYRNFCVESADVGRFGSLYPDNAAVGPCVR